MRRREFIGALGGAAVGSSIGASAQQPRKVPVVGFLHPGFPPDSPLVAPGTSSFSNLINGLGKAGYVDGETVRIEGRWGLGKPETLAGLAEELVRLKVDALVAVARPSIEAAKAATGDMPIVALDLESDPVASGYVASLARPSGNITGLFLDAPELTGKWLQQIREAVPGARKIGVLWDAGTGDYQLSALSTAAKAIAVELQVLEFRSTAGMESALIAAVNERPQALIQLGSPLVQRLANRIAEAAAVHHMPAISMFREFPESGGLMSYGPVLPVWWSSLGSRYVDAILKGAKPGDLAVERPNYFEFILNAKAAAALGLKIPQTLLAQADNVIE